MHRKIERRCTAERATKTTAMHALLPPHGGVERAVKFNGYLYGTVSQGGSWNNGGAIFKLGTNGD